MKWPSVKLWVNKIKLFAYIALFEVDFNNTRL